MKKLVLSCAVALAASALFAQDLESVASDVEDAEIVESDETKAEDEAEPQEDLVVRATDSVWPAFFSICEWPANPDVVGLRLTIPYSTRQEHVTGIDLGFWGQTLSFDGIQVSIIRNDVKDRFSGIQVGLYNSIGSGEMLGVQVGLWNEANAVRGIQAGLVNVSGETQGLQVGLINRAETMYGYQIGLVNVIRDAELQFFPILNIGF